MTTQISLDKWLAKYRATRADIKESEKWGKYILVDIDESSPYRGGRINLPVEYN